MGYISRTTNLTCARREQCVNPQACSYPSAPPANQAHAEQDKGSEDCLYLTVYGRPWTEEQQQPLRPVVVTFYGGGFTAGSASLEGLPPPAYPILNASKASDMLFVHPNYRTNAFGFLAGREVADDPLSDANAGLLDQHAVLLWVQRHAAAFGGDRDRVTIWGQSAGGGGVIAQTIAQQRCQQQPQQQRYGGGLYQTRSCRGNGTATNRRQRPLFRQALALSPYWPKTYRADDPEVQWRYDKLANLTDCAGPDSLACLKDADVQAIRDASLKIMYAHNYTTTMFG